MEFAPNNNPSFDKFARSAVFAVIARGAMILASVVGLPTAGFMLQRAITSVDHLAETTEQTRVTLVLIQQRLEDIRDVQRDHETRLRQVESAKR